MNIVAEKLKKLRKENKKTQIELARISNLSQSNYGKYELGEIEPNINTLVKIANYYNVSLDYLCGRKTPYQQDIGYLTNEQYKLIEEIKKLNELNTMRAFAYITGLLESQK